MTNRSSKTCTDLVFELMYDFKPWTFWDLQQTMADKVGQFYGEPTISASIREIRRPSFRKKYKLPDTGEVIIREKRSSGKGYQYRLAPTIINHHRS